MRGGDREAHARRSPSTLSVRPREPTKQMGPFQQPPPAQLELPAPPPDKKSRDHEEREEVDPPGFVPCRDLESFVVRLPAKAVTPARLVAKVLVERLRHPRKSQRRPGAPVAALEGALL